MNKIILTSAFILFFLTKIFAQSATNKDELQKQRQQLKAEIEETERILNETKTTTKVNVGQLSTINKRINLQDNVIDNISKQLRFIETDIYTSQRQVNKLAKILDTLKQEYAKSMVYAYKNRNNYDFLNFMFSASSFNDAIKRITYLKSYRTYREMQGDNILRTQDLLQQRINELSGNKQKKSLTLQEQSKEMTELEKQQAEKEKIVAKLKGRQKELSTQITNKRKQDAKLKGVIAAMIKREIEIARKKAEIDRLAREKAEALNNPKTTSGNNTKTINRTRPATKSTGSVLVSSEADKILNASFEKNRGVLPWPSDGYILNHYGANQYPGPDKIDYNNPGVSIGTQVGAPVKAVFDGEVTLVNYIEDRQVVFLKHGKYFTVYSNLASASVQRGQTVQTGQLLGKAAANDDGQGEVDLIIMKESNNVNPEQWLRKK